MSKPVFAAADAVAEGLADLSDALWDAVAPMLVVALAAGQPAWQRQAAREWAEGDYGIDWAYEDWKMEREFAAAEREYEDTMARLADDGNPIHLDPLAGAGGRCRGYPDVHVQP